MPSRLRQPRTGTVLGKVELAIGGMTCVACAARVERKLGKLPGVTATVNDATEKAAVSFPPELSPQQLVEQVQAADYSAILPRPGADEPPERGEHEQPRSLRWRLAGSAALSIPVSTPAMVPGLRFAYWEWLSGPSATSRRPSAGRRRAAQPHDRRCRDGAELGLRRHQQPAHETLPPGSRELPGRLSRLADQQGDQRSRLRTRPLSTEGKNFMDR